VIDIKHQINEVRREVGSRTLEAGEARVVIISQTYNGSLDDVWDACTNPERIRRWFMPISGDLKLGGRYQLEGNAGGIVQRCDPPNSFAATWEFGGQLSWIEVRLAEQPDGRIQLDLEHLAPVTSMWAEFGPGAVGVGWDLILLGLALHLSGGEQMDPQQGAIWVASDDGRQFIGLSSDSWCRASVDAGTSRDEAEAAAERTLAFYTGSAPAADPE
jgi:uncharacterized protein YndB with AHSA1/START domain